MDLIYLISAGLFGLCLGSFLNVCIYRLPLGLSVIGPRSFCPRCKRPIRAMDNIPILSFLLLKGRCKTCGERISIVYPLVEMTTAILVLLLYERFGLSLKGGLHLLFVSTLIVISFIDLEHRIIPDLLSIGGLVAGLLASLFMPQVSFWDSLLGAFIGGGGLFLIAWLYMKIKKIEGLGGGDIKLIAMIGAWLGYKALIPVLLIGSLIGLLVGMFAILIFKKGRYFQIPFGPFLSLGAVIVLFMGPHPFAL